MPSARRLIQTLAAGLLAMIPTAAGATGRIVDHPTRSVADQRMAVKTPAGSGAVPVYVSRDWSVRRADVTRAIVLLHGTVGRDVFVRMAPRLGARESNRDTLVIAPQFLTDLDAKAHHLAPDVLRWRLGSLGNGADAVGPAAINPFEVLDAILTRLADRAIFPGVTLVVLAGHSGGGQMVHRYAIVGRGNDIAAKAGIRLRYVVANPNTYLYFSDERPTPDARIAPFRGPDCPRFNRWRYGLAGAPAYVGNPNAHDLERAYAGREVIYLLGMLDNDPNHWELDKSCMGEAQGPNRHARGVSYVRYLRERHRGTLNHRIWEVPGVGHHGNKMLGSACGLAALYGKSPPGERCER